VSIDTITAIISVVLGAAFFLYVFRVMHKWSKLADEIKAICDEEMGEERRRN